MEIENLKKHVNIAIREIQTLTGSTENIYGAIYEQLPRFEQEIELTLGETAILLEYFIPAADIVTVQENGSKQDDMLKLSQVLRRFENNFSMNSERLVGEGEIRRSLNHFMGNDRDKKVGIDALLDMMVQIRKRLTEIEIVSLNAIIHAAHLGDTGRAFGVISDNINTLSNQVSGQYVQLEAFAQSLSDWNDQFVNGLQEMLKSHNDLTALQREDLKVLITLTFDSLDKINFLLSNLISHIKTVVEPVQEIMVSIQAQDIIRQSMENLNKCLESLMQAINDYNPVTATKNTGTLELLNFASGALELTVRLADNIDAELSRSLLELDSQLTDISLRLAELEEEGGFLTNFLGGCAGDESNGDTVSTIFIQVRNFMESFGHGLTLLQERIDGFSNTNNLFYTHISGLEKKIQTIRGQIDFLSKLGLMTRIELARMGQEDDSFARDISNITDRVVKDVNANEELIVSMKRKLEQELIQFEIMIGQNREKVVTMLHITEEAAEKLDYMEILISRAVQSLGQGCGNLMKAVEQARSHMEQGRQLPAKLKEIRSYLLKLGDNLSLFRAQSLAAAGLEKCEGTSSELQILLNSLTTYLERVSAREVLTDIEMDVGSESGDLTFF